MVSRQFSEIKESLRELEEAVPGDVRIVAVSKFQPVEAIAEAYSCGQRLFGESRVRELLDKEKLLPDDIEWHFIGHLQTNKVKQLIGKAALIQSVDSERLLALIDAESAKKGLVTKVLLQVHIAKEETKFGFSPEELKDFFRSGRYKELSNTRICGLMTMATNTSDEDVVRSDFSAVASIFREIKSTDFGMSEYGLYFRDLSMGMSGDWKIAVEEGANIVRIGSAIFGERH